VRRLTEAAAALRAVYEAEAEQMRFEGTLDEALLGLQDLFEALLLKLKHPAPPVDDDDIVVASVLPAERQLCARVLECFAKIATAFFRFADGVAAVAREPQRLFKLLDMLDAVDWERDCLDDLFSGESAALAAIHERAREVEHALARAAAAVFFELGLRMETDYVSGADDATFPRLCGTP
jgi:hypothetical protein